MSVSHAVILLLSAISKAYCPTETSSIFRLGVLGSLVGDEFLNLVRMKMRKSKARLLSRLSGSQRIWTSEIIRNETFGGSLLLVAAVSALLLANSPIQSWIVDLKNFKVGPEFLQLSVGSWAADALLAIFFLAAGIELKHELVHGSLKEKSRAMVPIFAALGGMVVPATIYALLNFGQDTAIGWGIPMATDIAFALAILAVVGRSLPIELRAFLLTLAVVDDLGAIIVIAIFYTSKFALIPFLTALALLVLFGTLQRKGIGGWYIYVSLGLAIWFFVHESGIHATVAGIAMGLLMNMNKSENNANSVGDRVLHLIHPYSAVLAVPVFAFFSSAISISDIDLGQILDSTMALGIFLGLVLGKPIGVFAGAYLISKIAKVNLARGISWWDIAAIGSLAGVGFTVALLISDLAFKANEGQAKVGVLSVLTASLTSALIATICLALRRRSHLRTKID